MGFSLDLVFIDVGLDLEWVFWQVWVAVVMVGLCWVGGWIFVFFFFFIELLWPLGKRGSLNEVEREKKLNIKCKSYSNRAYMHSYCSSCAFMHTFTPTDVSAFLFKICKMRCFFALCKTLHLARLCIYWCGLYMYVDLDWKVTLTWFSPYATGQET